ncbi:bifunctional adenosylcobinamide kinase/adenosylcobinamide-phosphate guanylyltransferase [Sulfuricurvum sp.]|uniref:bifunctional adenosylcobinamide kinase/adenosylcobinamide-phosphate guanylyltransferase n=1 Tax=Sulfuricurvum sp. TaxID=2025608 RepID=UPI0019896A6E|nr:bifunctional adenosylcobinamide kinase/adenosylcobinamide-phosphate guanylyltransferase [Sulfuricurvum sp.]MBD3806875.1 bifunctional adenosylcobinamide kinase/adenosylcobinamide-phosphate guanylyltransferase [Sulfuricurvum sp.]
MKILYFGGQKSGKSSLAETKALALATDKPYYLATYDHSFGDDEMKMRIVSEIETLGEIDANIVFVLNDVGSGVIPNDPISRRYVDLSGIIAQALARCCDEVYEVKLGLEKRLK